MDGHTLAAINLAGTLLDLMGGLYLAYDLLGGRKGPLRVITRIATYSLVFGLGYGLPLGVRFGLFAAIGLITAYALRFSPSEEYQPAARPRFSREKLLATCVRGFIIGVTGVLAGALTQERMIGPLFGLKIGLIVAVVGGIVGP